MHEEEYTLSVWLPVIMCGSEAGDIVFLKMSSILWIDSIQYKKIVQYGHVRRNQHFTILAKPLIGRNLVSISK